MTHVPFISSRRFYCIETKVFPLIFPLLYFSLSLMVYAPYESALRWEGNRMTYKNLSHVTFIVVYKQNTSSK